MAESTRRTAWTFLTNHGHVLCCLAEEPDVRARDIAARVGITERAAQTIVSDLVTEGYVTRIKEGRRNRYVIHPDVPLRHSLESDRTIGDLLGSLGKLRTAEIVTP
jgi:hypothetical protein